MNIMQSGHGGGHDQPVWGWIMADFARTPPKPTIGLEPIYEDRPIGSANGPDWVLVLESK